MVHIRTQTRFLLVRIVIGHDDCESRHIYIATLALFVLRVALTIEQQVIPGISDPRARHGHSL